MADSYHTLREDVVAARSVAAAGSRALRIVVRPPRLGDHHPLSKADIEVLRVLLPREALHGLRRIELRPRNHDIGSPFAQYWPGERTIVLYSLTTDWSFDACYFGLAAEVRRAGAIVSTEGTGMRVHWPDRDALKLWFFLDVLGHEIGHHFDRQFRRKNGRNPLRRGREAFAELTSRRLHARLHRQLGPGH
jgi:hypothetical protein